MTQSITTKSTIQNGWLIIESSRHEQNQPDTTDKIDRTAIKLSQLIGYQAMADGEMNEYWIHFRLGNAALTHHFRKFDELKQCVDIFQDITAPPTPFAPVYSNNL